MSSLQTLITTGEAADYLGVPIGTLRRWAKKGSVPYVVLPSGRLRFDKADLDAAVRRVETVTEPIPA